MSATNEDTSAIPYKKSFGKEKRVNLVEDVPLLGPLLVHVEPTNICNFKCVCCPESLPTFKELSGGFTQLSMEGFDIIATQLATVSTVKVMNFFAMGEPLSNKNTINFIKIAKNKNLSAKYMLSSNGSLLTHKLHRDLCESGLDFLRISIFGSNEEMHHDVTKSKTKLSEIRENIIKLKEFRIQNGFTKPVISVKMIDSGDAAINDEFFKNFSEIGDETILEPLTNWHDSVQEDFSKQYASYQGDLLTTNHYRHKKEVCPYPFYSLIVHADLRVSVCCVDWDKKLIAGDLKKETLAEIWHGDKFREIQLKHLQRRKSELDGCRHCTYIHTAIDNIDDLDEKTFLGRLAGVP